MKEITEQEYEVLQTLFQEVCYILKIIHGIEADSIYVGSNGVDVYYHNEDIGEISIKKFSKKDILGNFKKDILGNLKYIKNNKLKNDPDYHKYLELKKKFE